MRRRERSAPVLPPADPEAEPPEELLRFRPSQPAPIGPHGRPEPWAVKWHPDDFAAWLRARAAWRDTHTRPLYGLWARDRLAMHNMAPHLPRALVVAEEAANRNVRPAPYRPAGRPDPRPDLSKLEESPA